jgi:hypothetical protein
VEPSGIIAGGLVIAGEPPPTPLGELPPPGAAEVSSAGGPPTGEVPGFCVLAGPAGVVLDTGTPDSPAGGKLTPAELDARELGPAGRFAEVVGGLGGGVPGSKGPNEDDGDDGGGGGGGGGGFCMVGVVDGGAVELTMGCGV